MVKPYLGRHIYGFAAVLFGLVALAWHDFNIWQQIRVLGDIAHRGVLVYIYATVELVGGIAIQWRKTARAGAVILGATSLVFALLWVPLIAGKPQVYDFWGNFFEQFSLVSGALIVYATVDESDTKRSAILARIGYFCFGVCVISFTLEQLFYLSGTASFVPKWIPPGQMFWAIATTIAFALAALALFTGFWDILASRLLTGMIIGFGLLIWLPAPFVDPHKQTNWAGNAENLAIAGAAWIVADYLSQRHSVATAPVPEALGGGESFRLKAVRG